MNLIWILSLTMKAKRRSIPKRILILCEGESEVRYFKSYRMDNDNRDRLRGLEIEIYKPHDHSPVGLVKEAKARCKEAKRDKMAYEVVWVVFDKDGHANISNAFEEALLSNFNIKIVFSAVCFEYWFLLHFHKRKLIFANGDAIVSFIKKHCIPGYCKVKVGFQDLKDRLDLAFQNAEWLHKQNSNDLENGIRIYDLDSYTDVDLLMKYLQGI